MRAHSGVADVKALGYGPVVDPVDHERQDLFWEFCTNCADRLGAPFATQVAFVRDIFGNPFCPVSFDPAWRNSTVTALATAAYEERLLPSGHLEGDRLAILADALEDVGCDNADILSHLRGPGPHVRGCFVIDLLLGKA